tara:strand:- start:348 stop:872 length:525 start_codon:yes stop_codon:yes gene_type:complete
MPIFKDLDHPNIPLLFLVKAVNSLSAKGIMMTKLLDFHENLDTKDEVKIGSERSFGIVFAILFLIIASWPLIDGGDIRIWAAITASLFLGISFLIPKLLQPLNLVWFQLGLVLHKIVNPLVMGFVFFFTVTPIALIMRSMGKDPLSRNFDSNTHSYWIIRDQDDPEPDSMRRQF